MTKRMFGGVFFGLFSSFSFLFFFSILFSVFILFLGAAGCNGDDPGRNGDGGTFTDGGVRESCWSLGWCANNDYCYKDYCWDAPPCDTEKWPFSGCPSDKICDNDFCSKPFRASIEFRFPKVEGVQLTGSITIDIEHCKYFSEVHPETSWCTPENSDVTLTCEVDEICKFDFSKPNYFEIVKFNGDAAKYVFARKGVYRFPREEEGYEKFYRNYETGTDRKIDWNGEAEYGIKVDGIYRIEETGRSERVTSSAGSKKTEIFECALSNRTFHGVFPSGTKCDGEISEDITRISSRQTAPDGELYFDHHYVFVSSGSGG